MFDQAAASRVAHVPDAHVRCAGSHSTKGSAFVCEKKKKESHDIHASAPEPNVNS